MTDLIVGQQYRLRGDIVVTVRSNRDATGSVRVLGLQRQHFSNDIDADLIDPEPVLGPLSADTELHDGMQVRDRHGVVWTLGAVDRDIWWAGDELRGTRALLGSTVLPDKQPTVLPPRSLIEPIPGEHSHDFFARLRQAAAEAGCDVTGRFNDRRFRATRDGSILEYPKVGGTLVGAQDEATRTR